MFAFALALSAFGCGGGGTECGEEMELEVRPRSSSPTHLTPLGDYLYFEAMGISQERSWWRVNLSTDPESVRGSMGLSWGAALLGDSLYAAGPDGWTVLDQATNEFEPLEPTVFAAYPAFVGHSVVFREALYYSLLLDDRGERSEMWRFDGISNELAFALPRGPAYSPLIIGDRLFFVSGGSAYQYDGSQLQDLRIEVGPSTLQSGLLAAQGDLYVYTPHQITRFDPDTGATHEVTGLPDFINDAYVWEDRVHAGALLETFRVEGVSAVSEGEREPGTCMHGFRNGTYLYGLWYGEREGPCNDAEGADAELIASVDGNSISYYADLNPDNRWGSYPKGFVGHEGAVWFTAEVEDGDRSKRSPKEYGRELWVVDIVGPRMVADLAPGSYERCVDVP